MTTSTTTTMQMRRVVGKHCLALLTELRDVHAGPVPPEQLRVVAEALAAAAVAIGRDAQLDDAALRALLDRAVAAPPAPSGMLAAIDPAQLAALLEDVAPFVHIPFMVLASTKDALEHNHHAPFSLLDPMICGCGCYEDPGIATQKTCTRCELRYGHTGNSEEAPSGGRRDYCSPQCAGVPLDKTPLYAVGLNTYSRWRRCVACRGPAPTFFTIHGDVVQPLCADHAARSAAIGRQIGHRVVVGLGEPPSKLGLGAAALKPS